MDVLRARLDMGLPLLMSSWIARSGRRRALKDGAVILMLHGTPRARAAELERQLAYLRHHFDIVPLDALVAALEIGANMHRRLALTFDDGLRNNVQVAYPILQRLRVPATFFVCPALVDRGHWLWNQEMRQRLRRLGLLELRQLAERVGGPASVEPFVQWAKTLELAARQRVECRVREATHGFVPSSAEHEAFDLADWDELRGLDPRLVKIGSHTLTHPILTSLDARETEVEIAESRRVLEKRLGREADLFCYPNGDFDDGALDCARKHYRAAVSVNPGRVSGGCDLHRLPRAAIPRGVLRLAWQIYP